MSELLLCHPDAMSDGVVHSKTRFGPGPAWGVGFLSNVIGPAPQMLRGWSFCSFKEVSVLLSSSLFCGLRFGV